MTGGRTATTRATGRRGARRDLGDQSRTQRPVAGTAARGAMDEVGT